MTKHYRLGNKVRMTEEALENYGEQYSEVTFEIIKVSKSTKDHPGFDDSVYPDWLYDLKNLDNGEYFPGSLYDYELLDAYQ